jgi:hypothetical protein
MLQPRARGAYHFAYRGTTVPLRSVGLSERVRYYRLVSLTRPATPTKPVRGNRGSNKKHLPTKATRGFGKGPRSTRCFAGKYLQSSIALVTLYKYYREELDTVWWYVVSYLLWEALDQCGGDFSRENVMEQATDKRTSNCRFSYRAPKCTSPTAPTDYHTVAGTATRPLERQELDTLRRYSRGDRHVISQHRERSADWSSARWATSTSFTAMERSVDNVNRAAIISQSPPCPQPIAVPD